MNNRQYVKNTTFCQYPKNCPYKQPKSNGFNHQLTYIYFICQMKGLCNQQTIIPQKMKKTEQFRV